MYEGCFEGHLHPAGVLGAFTPTFPGTCPYITSVGATQIPSGGAVTDSEEASRAFASGGGFSNFFALPCYQEDAVGAYFKDHHPALPKIL